MSTIKIHFPEDQVLSGVETKPSTPIFMSDNVIRGKVEVELDKLSDVEFGCVRISLQGSTGFLHPMSRL